MGVSQYAFVKIHPIIYSNENKTDLIFNSIDMPCAGYDAYILTCFSMECWKL